MIPVVGPIFAAIPAILVALTVSPKTALFVIVFFIAQQQIENHLLVPKVMERQVGVSAVTVIVALLIGGALLGIFGALLAVPTAAILQVITARSSTSVIAARMPPTSARGFDPGRRQRPCVGHRPPPVPELTCAACTRGTRRTVFSATWRYRVPARAGARRHAHVLGVTIRGLHIEANPIISSAVEYAGLGRAVAGAKLAAMLFGILLHMPARS